MTIKTLIVANILAFAGVALAAEPGAQPKPRACAQYSVATLKDGTKLGVCVSGKKPVYLRTFELVKIVDPATGAAVSVMVGFQ